MPAGPRDHAPRVALPERSLAGVRTASRAAFDLLERELPGSRAFLSYLDYRRRRFQVVACSEDFGSQLEPGFTIPLEEAPCFHMASGNGPRLCGDVATDPVYGPLAFCQAVEMGSYAGVPLELPAGPRPGSLALLQQTAAILADVLEAEAAQEGAESPALYLQALAETDQLTGALNRPTFVDRLEESLRGRSRARTSYLLYVRPESFQAVVDRYGRGVGELVLRDITDALSAVSEAGDAVGRVGKTELAALLGYRPTPARADYHRRQAAARLGDMFAKRGITVTMQAGLVPLDHDSAEEALDAARAAIEPLVLAEAAGQSEPVAS